jgi:hypothetical protein
MCVVAVLCLAAWLGAVAYAAAHPKVKHRRVPNMPGPVLGGMHLAEGGRSVAPNRDALARVPAQRTGEADQADQAAADQADQAATGDADQADQAERAAAGEAGGVSGGREVHQVG